MIIKRHSVMDVSFIMDKSGKKRRKFMFIKEFVESYSNFATQNLKDNYLKDNLEITTYVPFVKKVTYAASLAQNTMIDKDTGNVRVSSESNYLFFVRSIIELYTDLEIENNAFYDEYDLLNESGLLDKIMQMIPEKEIAEFKMICDMKKDDIIFNQSTPKAFVNQQIERITNIASVALKPVLDKLATELENMDDEKITKLSKALEKGLKRVK